MLILTKKDDLRNPERGSAIVMLFIAVALFGALAYAFMKNSRGSTSIMTGEATKTEATSAQMYSMLENQAIKRLKLRGCKDNQISYETPSGANPNPLAPTDERCHVYRVNGGGITYKEAAVPTGPDPCTSGPIGTVCTTDGAIYIGMIGSRVYLAPSDQGMYAYNTNNSETIGSTSKTNGVANTAAMIASAISHPAAEICDAKSPAGTWYLPAEDELNLVWIMKNTHGITAPGLALTGSDWYWASTQRVDYTTAQLQRFLDGMKPVIYDYMEKNVPARTRCVRH